VALLSTVGFALAACGRVGPLETPPGPAVSPTASTPPGPEVSPTASALPPPSAGAVSSNDPYSPNTPAAQEKAQKSGFDIYGNPVAPAGQQKPFLLDPILR
jgi:predicted small lipoprotein YifL